MKDCMNIRIYDYGFKFVGIYVKGWNYYTAQGSSEDDVIQKINKMIEEDT